jgi:hypothetical protein
MGFAGTTPAPASRILQDTHGFNSQLIQQQRSKSNMNTIYSEPSRVHPGVEVRAGTSSWNTNDTSIKYAARDIRDHVTRGGEVPAAALPQMMEVAIKAGYLSLSDVLRALATASESGRVSTTSVE